MAMIFNIVFGAVCLDEIEDLEIKQIVGFGGGLVVCVIGMILLVSSERKNPAYSSQKLDHPTEQEEDISTNVNINLINLTFEFIVIQ